MDKQSFSQCNICLENIFDFNEFVTNCNHCYHLNCIYTWYVYPVITVTVSSIYLKQTTTNPLFLLLETTSLIQIFKT